MNEQLEKNLLDWDWLGPRIKKFRERSFKDPSALKDPPYRMTSVSNIESGRSGPSWEFLVRLTAACGSTLHDLVDEIEPRSPEKDGEKRPRNKEEREIHNKLQQVLELEDDNANALRIAIEVFHADSERQRRGR